MICGAGGARPDSDGIEAITNAAQNLSNTPVETLEANHPVRVESYELIPDSCGPGQYRGGLGICRSYRILAEGALLQLRADRMKFQHYGLAGDRKSVGWGQSVSVRVDLGGRRSIKTTQ